MAQERFLLVPRHSVLWQKSEISKKYRLTVGSRRTGRQAADEGAGGENSGGDLKRVARFVARLVQEDRKKSGPDHDADLQVIIELGINSERLNS